MPSQPASARRGFTLLELILALTLTAITATVAGTALAAARRTTERVSEHRDLTQIDARWRGLLTDMLRHPPRADQVNEPLLSLVAGASGPELRFLTMGMRAPLGTGAIWRVIVRNDDGGAVLFAEPLATDRDETPVQFRLEGVQLGDITVLEPSLRDGAPAQWRADWPMPRQRPAAIAMAWRRDSVRYAPLVQPLDPLGEATR